MSRRCVVAALMGLLIAMTAAPSGAQLYRATLDGRTVTLTPQPISVGNTVLLPLRDTLTVIGATDIVYSDATGQVSFVHEGRQIMLDLNQNTATIDGQTTQLPGMARVLNGTTWVPAQFITSLEPDFGLVTVRGFRGQPGVPPAPIPQPFGPSTFTINGQTFSYASPTWYMGGVLMVPLDETLLALGLSPSTTNPGDLQASFIWNNQIVRLNVESGYAHVGDAAFPLARPVVVRGDTMYVPASFFANIAPGYNIAGMQAPATEAAVLGFRGEGAGLEATK
ncbi:MAG: hypothetical protein GX774_02045 [Armatimonadetes bacterium]|jgi:hypothetical protein|nr:hypothetical protein [Armatimonadota bacterium]